MRALSTILKEADNCKTIKELSFLSTEIFKTRFKRPSYESAYGLERIKELAEIKKNEYEIKMLFDND